MIVTAASASASAEWREAGGSGRAVTRRRARSRAARRGPWPGLARRRRPESRERQARPRGPGGPLRPRRGKHAVGRRRLRLPTVTLRRPSTPFLLRLGMALACLPVAFFATAVQLGVARNDSTVRTVGRDATRGITVAQAIKLNLAELDEIVARRLLDPVELGPSGFPDDYNDTRAELHDNLVLAASTSSSGAAYRQPLANIDYVLSHYHTLVEDAFAAREDGDTARASQLYDRAHEVVDGTLLPEADFVDKANTYVLNDAYDTQKARSASTGRLIVASWVVLLAFLVVVQVLVARRFRRVVNLALGAATVLAAASGAFALTRLDASASDLAVAREQAFDSVHVLARARATVVSARQAQAQLLLDPADASGAQESFQAQAGRLLRVQGRSDVAALAQAGTVPEEAGGYLATVADAGTAGSREGAVRRTIVAFGGFLAADAELRELVAAGDTDAAAGLYQRGEAFAELTAAIDDAQEIDQGTFDEHARAANTTARLRQITVIAAAGVLALVLVGLYQRLREYRS